MVFPKHGVVFPKLPSWAPQLKFTPQASIIFIWGTNSLFQLLILSTPHTCHCPPPTNKAFPASYISPIIINACKLLVRKMSHPTSEPAVSTTCFLRTASILPKIAGLILNNYRISFFKKTELKCHVKADRRKKWNFNLSQCQSYPVSSTGLEEQGDIFYPKHCPSNQQLGCPLPDHGATSGPSQHLPQSKAMRLPGSVPVKSLAQNWGLWCWAKLFRKEFRIWAKCRRPDDPPLFYACPAHHLACCLASPTTETLQKPSWSSSNCDAAANSPPSWFVLSW